MKLWNRLAAGAAMVVLATSMTAPAMANPGSDQAEKKTVAGAADFKVPGAIGERWKALGGADGVMGAPTAEQECDLRLQGCKQSFAEGDLVWTPDNGRVHGIRGAILAKWNELGAESGTMGYPLTDETCDTTGCSQVFEKGQLHFTAGKGTFQVLSPLLEAYGRTGDAAGPLGHPVADRACDLPEGGCFQTYENGSIYHSPETNSWFVRGPIGEHWGVGGWEQGNLGYPMGDEACELSQDGCFQTYENGSIYWSKDTGAAQVGGAIGEAWGVEGWETGWLGFPTSEQGQSDAGSWQTFQGGNLYQPKDKDVMAVRGDILARWGEYGFENGELGWPLTGEFCDLRDGGCGTQFENGSIYFSPDSGAHMVRGKIRDVWAAKGWETSYLGYPTSEENCSIGGDRDACFQSFQFGSIYWSRDHGAYPVSGPVLRAWAAEGYETGDLGFPMSDLHFEDREGNKVYFQEFEHGFVEYTEGHDPSVVMK